MLPSLRVSVNKLFTKYLLLTNTISCSALLGLGDAIQQTIERSKEDKKYDWKRTGRMAFIGLVLFGPTFHVWYKYLDRVYPGNTGKIVAKKIVIEQLVSPSLILAFFLGRMTSIGLVLGPCNHVWYGILDRYLPERSGKIVVKKIILDQLLAAPFFAFAFVIGMGLLEGETMKNSFKEFKQKFPTIYLIDWCIWPPAQAINFLFLQPRFRVIYVNTITLGWDTFMSYIKHKQPDIEPPLSDVNALQKEENQQKDL